MFLKTEFHNVNKLLSFSLISPMRILCVNVPYCQQKFLNKASFSLYFIVYFSFDFWGQILFIYTGSH